MLIFIIDARCGGVKDFFALDMVFGCGKVKDLIEWKYAWMEYTS